MVYLTCAVIGLGGWDEIKRGLKRLHSAPLHVDVWSHLSGSSAIQVLATSCRLNVWNLDLNVSSYLLLIIYCCHLRFIFRDSPSRPKIILRKISGVHVMWMPWLKLQEVYPFLWMLMLVTFIFLKFHHCFVVPPIYKNAFTPWKAGEAPVVIGPSINQSINQSTVQY